MILNRTSFVQVLKLFIFNSYACEALAPKSDILSIERILYFFFYFLHGARLLLQLLKSLL